MGASAGSPARGSVVCLGEALIDFVSEAPVEDVTEAPSFVPRFGGSVANIAVGAARFGAATAMLGGAGPDPWGAWLRRTLAAREVDVSWFELLEGAPTPHTFVAVSEAGEPSYAFFGSEGRQLAIASIASRLSEPFGAEGGVFIFGSDTLNGGEERQITLRARDLALDRGWLVAYDPNLRPVRWADPDRMLEVARGALPGATLVKANLDEARALSGRERPDDAARGLVAQGARAAVVTLGADGILVVVGDDAPKHVDPVPARVVDATGAGDSVGAVLVAALARTRDVGSLVPAAAVAARTAAGVTESRGALDGLPPPAEARARLDAALGA